MGTPNLGFRVKRGEKKYEVGSVGNKSHRCIGIMRITLHQQLDLMSDWKSALKRKSVLFSVK